jgi:hypothetical protein
VISSVMPITKASLICTDRSEDRQRAHHPLRQINADFARAECRAKSLLYDQASPRSQAGCRAVAHRGDGSSPIDQQAERAGHDERDDHGDKE